MTYRPKYYPPGFTPFTAHLCPACGIERPLSDFYERPDRPLFRRSRWSTLCKVHECTRIRQKRANGKGAAQRRTQRLAAKSRALEAASAPNVIAYQDGRGRMIATRPDWQERYDTQRREERGEAARMREQRALMRYWREVNGIRTRSFGDIVRERRLREAREAALPQAPADPMPSDDPYADPVRQAEAAIWVDDSLSSAEKFARLRALRSREE